MRLIATTLAITLALTTTAMTQEVRSPRTENAAKAADARVLLEEVADTYRRAPALTDSLRVTFDQDAMQIDLRFDEKGNSQIRMPGGLITVLDGTLYVEDDMLPEKYLSLPIERDLETTLASLYGPDMLLPYHFAMRANRGVDDYINSLTFGFLKQPKLEGLDEVQADDGERRHEIHITTRDGDARVHVHPQSKLITAILVEVPSPMMPGANERVRITMAATPEISKELSPEITFAPGDREAVSDPRELMPPPPRVVADGEPAPPFTLKTLDDEEKKLSEMRGKVVVLDFWATWCGPCIQALPMLDAFATWAEENEYPVEVFAVNVWEHRANSPEERKQMASNFWKSRDYETLTTLMDYEDSVIGAFGYQSIPTTVIIGPDGKVFSTHSGYSRDMEEMLRREVLAALEQD